MARLAQGVVSQMEGVEFKVVHTKTLEGATRYFQLSMTTTRKPPVPSIFINGELAFESTPTEDELIERINQALKGSKDV